MVSFPENFWSVKVTLLNEPFTNEQTEPVGAIIFRIVSKEI